MLVTTRHVGEAIIINGDIEIIVLGIKGNRVKIGTDAPKSVMIDRKEKWGRRSADTEGRVLVFDAPEEDAIVVAASDRSPQSHTVDAEMEACP